MASYSSALLLGVSLALSPSAVWAQFAVGTTAGEGTVTGPTSSPEAAGYNCDTTKCQLPNCYCASTAIPGGLTSSETPQFITWTSDDAVESYTIEAINHFLGNRTNPNGCPVKSTYFVSLQYTNFSLVTDWSVAGNEIADHTMTHVGDAPQDEIDGNLAALNAFSGIPFSSITGFRAPFLNYSVQTFQHLQAAQFTYDSSTSSATPVTSNQTDAYWPYTLDYGLANDCMDGVPGICKGSPVIPGLWEIPMYSSFDTSGMPHLMDAYLDNPNASTVLGWYQSTFTDHYNNNRQPFGLYQHPIHLAVGYPGVEDPLEQRAMINQFLDWAQTQQNVWLVTNQQLLAWMKNPKPVSQLNTIPEFQCETPQVTENICNGMYPNEVGLLENCPFSDFPWTTCYGCPQEQPSPSNPVPAQATTSGQALRNRVPANCSTPFWDPIGNKCLCQSSACQFLDTTKPIGPNGQNLTGGGTGSSDAVPTTTYVPFNSNSATASSLPLCKAFTALAAIACVVTAFA